MPKYKFDEIEGQLSKGRLFPVYLVYGEEHYLVRLIVDKIRAVYQAETTAEIERYSARGLDPVAVIDGLKTMPMWSKGKLIIIDEAASLSPKAKELMLAYVESPSPTAVLVFTSSEFDGRSKMYKMISEKGAVVELKAIYENQVPFWINRECQVRGYRISQEAAHFMTELLGVNLSDMASAVEKIILYIGSKKIIDLKDVETVLSDTSQKSIFDLTGAVGSRNLARANDRLANLLRNNEAPVVIVNMLARHWRLLLQAKELVEKGIAGDVEMAKNLRVHPIFVKEYISQSKGFTKKKLVKGLKVLWNADVAVKSSKLPRETILHNLIINLIDPV